MPEEEKIAKIDKIQREYDDWHEDTYKLTLFIKRNLDLVLSEKQIEDLETRFESAWAKHSDEFYKLEPKC